LQFVESVDCWETVLSDVLRFDTEVLMEEKIDGREITVGILEDRALPIVEIRPKQGGYDYRNKYTSGATDYLCPAPLDDAVAHQARDLALKAFQAVGGRDYARIDAMISRDNAVFLLEVNTLPGMTSTSLLPKAAAAVGIEFSELCQRMVAMARRRSRNAGVLNAFAL
jgi:D-alanine-D-alanine ligase